MKDWLGSILLNVSLLTSFGVGSVMTPDAAFVQSTVMATTSTTVAVTASPIPAAPATATAQPTTTVEPSPKASSLVPPAPLPTATAQMTATLASPQTDGPAPTPSGTASPTPSGTTSPAEPATETAPPPVGVPGIVQPIMVNLREGPGATYPILGSYARETPVQVLGKDRTGSWLRIVTPDVRAGWMASNCVRLPAPLARLPVVDGIPDRGESAGSAPAPAGSAPAPLVTAIGGVPAESGVDTKAAAVPNISDAPQGLGVVIVPETSLHIAPGSRTEVVQTLREEEQVKLFGQAKGAWVRVQPFTAVVPGWVYAAHLRPLPGAIEGAPVITATATLSTTATMTPTAPITPSRVALAPTPTRAPAVVEAVPEPVTDEPAPPLTPRVPLRITVDVVGGTEAVRAGRGAMPTPATRVGVAGLRVEIVTVFGDVLVEAVTPANGRVTFTRDVLADTALFVRIPALGLRTQLVPEQVAGGAAGVTITLPAAAG